tara:strand:- start:56 stop:586 length:531 start_codon:yes stop_codon:yes gene_type:complete
MELRLASINVDSVDLKSLEGSKSVYPVPMPVLAKKSSDDIFLIYSLVSQSEWMNTASANPTMSLKSKTSIPLELPATLFEKNFMPIGGNFDGTGIYGKIPNSVISLTVEVPCTYIRDGRRVSVNPNEVLIKTKSGNTRHFKKSDFERLFVDDLSQVRDMKVSFDTPKATPTLEYGE